MPVPPDPERYPVARARPAAPPGPLLVAPAPPPVDPGALAWSAYFRLLYAQRRRIVAVALLCTFVALLYALAARPVYEANLLVHVEEESPNASKNILNEMSSLFETKKEATAEMELLRSRLVVGRAVDSLHLYIEVTPRYFPLGGSWLAARADVNWRPGLFGYGGYVWGKERAEVTQFDVPDGWLERQFVLTALGGERYQLSDGGGRQLLQGRVGELARAGALALRVERIDAAAGAQFLLRRLSPLSTLEQIQNALVIAEQGKLSGVIEVRLQGHDAQRVAAVLRAIGSEYMRQNLARKTEEAEKTLAFLSVQLPVLKDQLEQAEASYNRFRSSHDTVDLGDEIKLDLQRAADAHSRHAELEQKRIDLLSRYTEAHPVLLALDQQLREVSRDETELALQIKRLPLLEQEETRLARDVKVSSDLYTALLNTSQQLRLLSVGRVSNVRLVDMPVTPEQPVGPHRLLIVALAALTGLFLGSGLALAHKAWSGGIDDPEAIEAMLGLRAVYASVPHSRVQERLQRNNPAVLLAQAAPDDAAIESLRALRAALLFVLPHCHNPLVCLAGPRRGVGTAFVAANLAVLLAASGRKTLLIDADLRAGRLHQCFGIAAAPGLAEAISGAAQLDQIVRPGVLDKLDFIAAGATPPNRAEYLQHLNFGGLLAALHARYDIVLIAAPPVLAVADALVIGAHAGALFLVARAGVTTQSELNESIKRLNHAGIAPHGVVFNGVAADRASAGQPERGSGSALVPTRI